MDWAYCWVVPLLVGAVATIGIQLYYQWDNAKMRRKLREGGISSTERARLKDRIGVTTTVGIATGIVWVPGVPVLWFALC